MSLFPPSANGNGDVRRGPMGPPGSRGNSLLHSEGVPYFGLGQPGDFCLDTLNSRVYGPKVEGSWTENGYVQFGFSFDPDSQAGAARVNLSNVDAATGRAALNAGFRDYINVDEFASLAAAYAAAVALGIRRIKLGQARYALSELLTLGNGSTAQFSNIPAMRWEGVGAAFVRQASGTPQKNFGTIIYASGVSRTNMIEILGPTSGWHFENILFDGQGLVDNLFKSYCLSRAIFEECGFTGMRANGHLVTTWPVTSIGGFTEGLIAGDIKFNNCQIWGGDYQAAPINGIHFNADPLGGGVTRCKVTYPYGGIWKNGSCFVRNGFTDQNTIVSPTCSQFEHAMNDAGTAWVINEGVSVFGAPWPQHCTVYGHGDPGQGRALRNIGTVGVGNGFYGTTSNLDRQIPLYGDDEKLSFMTGLVSNTGSLVDVGYPVVDRHRRSLWRNQGFLARTFGTTISGIASGQQIVDGVFATWAGTKTVNAYILPIAAADRAKFPPWISSYLRIECTASDGAAQIQMYCRYPGARIWAGDQISLSAFTRGPTGNVDVGYTWLKSFGTGGSPSASQGGRTDIDGQAFSVAGADWLRGPPFRFNFPAIGESITFGTNGDSYTIGGFLLPSGVFTADFAAPQLERGGWMTTPEFERPEDNTQRCRAHNRVCGAGITGIAASTTAIVFPIQFEGMSSGPSILTFDNSVVVNRPGTGNFTSSGSTVSATEAFGVSGGRITVNGFTGLTLGSEYQSTQDFFYLTTGF